MGLYRDNNSREYFIQLLWAEEKSRWSDPGKAGFAWGAWRNQLQHTGRGRSYR